MRAPIAPGSLSGLRRTHRFALACLAVGSLAGLPLASVLAQPSERRAEGVDPTPVGGTPDRASAGSGEEAASAGREPFVLTTRNVAGRPGRVIPLDVGLRASPERGAPTLHLAGLPKGARISDLAHAEVAADESTVIDITDWRLADLAVTTPPEQSGTYVLVAVAAAPGSGGGRPVDSTLSTFVLDVQPPGPSEPASVTAEADPPASRTTLETTAPRPAPMADAGPADLRPSDLQPAAGGPADPGAVSAAVFIPHLPAVALPAHLPEAAQPLAPETAQLLAPEAKPDAAADPTARAPRVASPPSPADPRAEADARLLLERSERLIRSGDISGARLLLERAMARGDARATRLLAQTYDPRMLRAWNVQGMRADPERARDLYDRAASGIPADARPMADTRH